MASDLGTCQFCGDENVVINDEHIYPVWLGDCIVELMNSPRIRITRDNRTHAPKAITGVHIKARCACLESCNGGWMKDLEDAVIPFLKPMVVSAAPTFLDHDRRKTLAAWCVKTAMTHEFTKHEPRPPYFLPDERRHLFTYLEPPSGVQVWIGQHFGASNIGMVANYPSKRGGQDVAPGYAFTLRAKDFIMQVLGHRSEAGSAPSHEGVPTGLLLQIWPLPARDVLLSWPPPTMVDEYFLEAFEQRFWSEPARKHMADFYRELDR